MRKLLWIILAVLAVLFVAIGAPNAHADTFPATFTCTGTCVSVPTAPDVSFPSPTTLTENWNTFTFAVGLLSGSAPSDAYIWQNQLAPVPTIPGTLSVSFLIFDTTRGSTSGAGFFVASALSPQLDSGVLSFAVPEPSSVALMLAGIGFLRVMRKRFAQGLHQSP